MRLLIYSHDTFGLGHLRRCRTIAHALVEDFDELSVLILSGSPIIGSFGFRSRVDFVRIPGVIKLRHGDYTSQSLDIAIEETLNMRASIIKHTAEAFSPDLMLVDKEPWGLRGEMKETLTMLKSRGVPLVLGLRDVMDSPELLEEEWARKETMPALADMYDHVWVYGLEGIHDPLEGLEVPIKVRQKMTYTGYLRREAPSVARPEPLEPTPADSPYILVTTGGGGDGAALVDWVISAYEHDPDIPFPALIVFGPFMTNAEQGDFMARVDQIDKLEAITFDARLEELMENATGVVCMGGYNSFCEVLSFDKRAIIVPRTVPRKEQYIRARQADKHGLVKMLVDDDIRDPARMAEAIRTLPQQPRPSEVRIPGLLEGLGVISDQVHELTLPHGADLSLVTAE